MYNSTLDIKHSTVHNNADHGSGAKQEVVNSQPPANPTLFHVPISNSSIIHTSEFVFHTIHRA